MIIQLNGEAKSLEKSVSLSDFIKLNLKLETRGIAVAVNQDVVPKKEWEGFILKENDHVEIVRATQGG